MSANVEVNSTSVSISPNTELGEEKKSTVSEKNSSSSEVKSSVINSKTSSNSNTNVSRPQGEASFCTWEGRFYFHCSMRFAKEFQFTKLPEVAFGESRLSNGFSGSMSNDVYIVQGGKVTTNVGKEGLEQQQLSDALLIVKGKTGILHFMTSYFMDLIEVLF